MRPYSYGHTYFECTLQALTLELTIKSLLFLLQFEIWLLAEAGIMEMLSMLYPLPGSKCLCTHQPVTSSPGLLHFLQCFKVLWYNLTCFLQFYVPVAQSKQWFDIRGVYHLKYMEWYQNNPAFSTCLKSKNTDVLFCFPAPKCLEIHSELSDWISKSSMGKLQPFRNISLFRIMGQRQHKHPLRPLSVSLQSGRPTAVCGIKRYNQAEATPLHSHYRSGWSSCFVQG